MTNGERFRQVISDPQAVAFMIEGFPNDRSRATLKRMIDLCLADDDLVPAMMMLATIYIAATHALPVLLAILPSAQEIVAAAPEVPAEQEPVA